MPFTEVAKGNGDFSVKLRPDTPLSVRLALKERDAIYLTPAPIDTSAQDALAVRRASIRQGLITKKTFGSDGSISVFGEGPGLLLGSGDSSEGIQSSQSGGVLGSFAAAIRLALTWPVVDPDYPSFVDYSSSQTESFFGAIVWQFGAPKTRKDIIDGICQFFDRYWVVDLTRGTRPILRAGSPQFLWGEPVTLIRREIGQITRRTIEWFAASRSTTTNGYSSKHSVLAPDIEITIPTIPPITFPAIPNKAMRTRSTPYVTPAGQPWHIMTSSIQNGINLPGLPILMADAELDRARRVNAPQVEVDLARYEQRTVSLKATQMVKIFDPAHPDLVSLPGEDDHDGGERIAPRTLMVSRITEPVTQGRGIYSQRGTAEAVDLTPWVEWETGSTKATLGEVTKAKHGLFNLFREMQDMRMNRRLPSS